MMSGAVCGRFDGATRRGSRWRDERPDCWRRARTASASRLTGLDDDEERPHRRGADPCASDVDGVEVVYLHNGELRLSMILLLGAQLSFYVQNPQYLRPGRGAIQLNASLRERVALSIMYLVVSDYRAANHRWTTNRLAEHLDLPGAGLSPIVTALERAKLLLLCEDETWVPARDPQMIELVEVLEAVRHDTAGPGSGASGTLRRRLRPRGRRKKRWRRA